jgi:hypothetical protein
MLADCVQEQFAGIALDMPVFKELVYQLLVRGVMMAIIHNGSPST